VEDVTAYVNFIKDTVGITHEDELIRAIEILVNKVHPLALGNVERFIAQSRMIARKILRTHMRKANEHAIDEIAENMASRLYFHGHPINRREAKEDLRLKVSTELTAELEAVMWDLYREYEEEFQNLCSPFWHSCPRDSSDYARFTRFSSEPARRRAPAAEPPGETNGTARDLPAGRVNRAPPGWAG
jgi:hypothetical protein